MPVVASSFKAPFFLRNGHAQTIAGALLPRKISLPFRRERLELADGDFLDLDWAGNEEGRLAIICHGLEGSSGNPSIRGLGETLHADGWDILAWNFRGCGGEMNRLPRFYHSGDTGDIGKVVEHAAKRYDKIALAGFSLGGNVILKYLGEAPPHPSVKAAIAISVPVDLASSARALDRRKGNRIYLGRFIKSLVNKVRTKERLFPGSFDMAGIDSIRSFQEFDDRYTARIHGFRDAIDYWTRSSSRQFLPEIQVPTLLVTAQDDPFLTEESLPFREAKASGHFSFEAPENGGHIGFLDGHGFWIERRAAEFLKNIL